ncbi:hypothetical protein Q428_00525 [Fervidicella metallireducens AeB]|uniref:Uncharacterized protein n=1 Tax=Fervidicella metallireducens AeB TaxID=1403537 RepID=A0A017S0U9_9CLOT|nr:DUF3006 domain-containing protein [Fervidicella metallireducens]EYE89810.1 hypothetical protein Q428_00525 [Fervidicella metallireducens AeB]
MRGVIDRFEGDYAVIIKDDGSIENVNRTRLPDEAKEGDVLIMEDIIKVDNEKTRKRTEEVEKYLDLWEE